jgi:phosphatidylserine/phosphatidylglycerophosphate/cardiolipin synthase-like enzyme
LEKIDVALIRQASKEIDMAAYVLTDSAVIEALRDASSHGVKVRVWRDASEAARLSEFDVEAQLGGRVQGLEIRSSAPGGELMHLKGYCVDHPIAHRFGELQPILRDVTGQRPRNVARRVSLRRV